MSATTFVGSGAAYFTSATGNPGNRTPAAGNDLICVIVSTANVTLSSIVSSVGATVDPDVPFAVDPTYTIGFGVYRVHNASAQTQTFDLTFSATPNAYVWIIEANNVGQFDQNAAVTSGTTTAFATGSITPSQNGAMALAFGGVGGGVTFTWGNSYTALGQARSGGPSMSAAYLDQATAAATSGSATLSAAHNWSGKIVSYVPISTTPSVTAVNGELSAPTQTSLTTSTTGGILAARTYYTTVTAYNAQGETLASNQLSVTTTGSTSTITSSWNAVSGATGYRYRRGLNAGYAVTEWDVGNVLTYVDTGVGGVYGVSPATNTTAPISEGATAVPMIGTNFASGMTAAIVQGSNSVAQANVVYTNSTTGAFDLVMEPTSGPQLAATDSVYVAGLEITTSGQTSGSFPVQLAPPAGVLFQTLASINPNAPLRFQTLPDLAVNDQVWAAGNSAGTVAAPAGLVLNSDGSFEFAAGYVWQNFWARAYIAADAAYTPWAKITVTGMQPGGFW